MHPALRITRAAFAVGETAAAGVSAFQAVSRFPLDRVGNSALPGALALTFTTPVTLIRRWRLGPDSTGALKADPYLATAPQPAEDCDC